MNEIDQLRMKRRQKEVEINKLKDRLISEEEELSEMTRRITFLYISEEEELSEMTRRITFLQTRDPNGKFITVH